MDRFMIGSNSVDELYCAKCFPPTSCTGDIGNSRSVIIWLA